MRVFFKKIIIVTILLLIYTTKAQTQNIELSYTTEFQNNIGSKSNWVNLFTLSGNFTPWRNGKFSIQTISIYKIQEKRIANDLQTFSNIEEDNMGINLFHIGYTHKINDLTLFGGIRNMNEDYFTGEYTSLFTNSSCGIYPTISYNYPVANYPLSAMTLHAEFRFKKSFCIKNSLYNGVARELFSKEGSLFSIDPIKDGILNITEFSYSSKSNYHGLYNIGTLFHTNHNSFNEYKQEKKKTKKMNYVLWANAEQSIYKQENKEVGILIQGSLAPTNKNDCFYYYGIGATLSGFVSNRKYDKLGVFINKAIFHENAETAIEITWQYNLNKNIIIQPAFHYIKTGTSQNKIGIIRCNYTLPL
ncbi:carbohydrate porin [Dysgonomonas sp. Marseille-P4677]|uniref:carbohydrate porin n=1 Tax=Dysgonomonas sp. Marseille-P4677 TaxID=2364790 RepID=UPI0019137AC6|nr:carbohydrate porin [Dysgonomonas sp. Marseille-P4677]MBK5722232.1 carbohydrate porin [Dysgonomonas sp. Marseille-P4677]